MHTTCHYSQAYTTLLCWCPVDHVIPVAVTMNTVHKWFHKFYAMFKGQYDLMIQAVSMVIMFFW